MKQTAIYAALQFILAQTGYRDKQLPVDGAVWAQSDQALWQVLATDKLNVPPHIAHEVPTSLEVLSNYKSVIPEWLDLVKAAEEHAALIEGETYEPPADAVVDDGDEDTDEGSEGEPDSGAPVDDPQDPVVGEQTAEAPAVVEETPAPVAEVVAESDAPSDQAADAEPAADGVAEASADTEDSEAAEEAASHGVDMSDDPEDIKADESNEAGGV